MAVKGAHLTGTTLEKPSLFELIAQDSLTATFHPAAKRLVEFIASRYPESSGWLVQWFEEIYLTLNTALQLHYLKHDGASFAETFYGLQRVCERMEVGSIQLPKRERLLSLLLLTLFPYFRAKLEEKALLYRLEEADGVVPRNGWSAKGRQVLMLFYRVTHLSWELWTLVQYLRYMSGSASSHSPALAVAGVTLCYAPEKESPYCWSQLWQAVTTGTFKFTPPTAQAIGSLLTHSLELSAFFIQFLQWWHSEQIRTDITALPTPNPPPVSEVARRFGGVCPICMRPWKVETLLSVSGLVFCYRCIRSHLNNSQSCPVTFYPATVQDLVRIYPSQA